MKHSIQIHKNTWLRLKCYLEESGKDRGEVANHAALLLLSSPPDDPKERKGELRGKWEKIVFDLPRSTLAALDLQAMHYRADRWKRPTFKLVLDFDLDWLLTVAIDSYLHEVGWPVDRDSEARIREYERRKRFDD